MSNIEILSLKFLAIMMICTVIMVIFLPEEHGYTKAETASMDRLVAKSSVPQSFKERQAEVLKDIWQISDTEIASPVRLWGGHD